MTDPVTTKDCCATDSNSLICTRLAAALLLLVSAASWVCMLYSVIPTFAALLSGQGVKFSLAVRLGIAAGNFLSGIPVIAMICLVLCAGFCLKDKKLGAAILMGAAILVTILVQTLILWSIQDILPYLAAR